MFDRLLAPLLEKLRPHFDLSKPRPETMAVLLVGLASCRTVNLSQQASQFPGDALHASNYRRLQRFFEHIRLNGEIGAPLTVQMLKLGRPNRLALDLTNWKLEARDVTVLVLAIATRRFLLVTLPPMGVFCARYSMSKLCGAWQSQPSGENTTPTCLSALLVFTKTMLRLVVASEHFQRLSFFLTQHQSSHTRHHSKAVKMAQSQYAAAQRILATASVFTDHL